MEISMRLILTLVLATVPAIANAVCMPPVSYGDEAIGDQLRYLQCLNNEQANLLTEMRTSQIEQEIKLEEMQRQLKQIERLVQQ